MGLLLASAPAARGATQKEIDRSIKAGADALKARYSRAGAAPGGFPAPPGVVGVGGDGGYGIGPTCLAGLALLEAKVPVNDPAIKTITELVRDAAYREGKTYQVALCLMYLDRFGDPADVPLIQALAMRLLVAQTPAGGWGYTCVASVPPDDEKRLRALKADQPAGKLHPEIEKYGQALAAARNQAGGPERDRIGFMDDNSNTQFAILAIWMARKHGVPVENALDLIEKRFMGAQDGQTGNWSYSGSTVPGAAAYASPAMYCAGLIGMATAVARREERRLKTDPPAGAKPDPKPKPDTKPGDPFYNPPAGTKPEPKPTDKRPADARDKVVQLAFAGLGQTIADQIRSGKGLLIANSTGHGNGDLYFLWSLERVGVVYGVDKIGGFDWYDVGSTALVRSQSPDGTWNLGTYGTEVGTSFAVLFLCRSNLARDLSSKVQKDPTSTEMRAGAGPSAADLLPNRPTPVGTPPVLPPLDLPNPTGDEAITLAVQMLKAPDADWAKLLSAARDAKGPTYTRALVVTATNTDGARKKAAREALSERLCRMSAATLRTMLKANEAELRRGAALACAMKDDRAHVPDLIDALADKDDSVVRAAKAGLKSLTGKDFGPASGASAEQKAAALAQWREWYAKEKK
jgi:hypothetical protein